MTFWTYILRCSDGKYYTGHTDNLEHRVAQHQAGEVPGWTSTRLPVALMWSEGFATREKAIAAEAQVGNWSRAKKEALFRGDWARVSEAARKPISRYAASTSSTATRNERCGAEAAAPSPPPVIVLVRPQLGENIGKAARAMLNFGLVEMRLVAPRDGWPNPSAGPAASGADVVLADAQVFDSVADAVADCGHVFATTVRKRGITKPVVTPEGAAHAIRTAGHRSAILFGPERSGLETDDVALARTIVTVPINPEFGSLNLAQAVILVAYEWSKGEGLASPPSADQPLPPAPHDELEGMIGQLDAMLEKTGFYFPPHRVQITRRTLRTLLTRPGWSSQEVRTFRGVLSALDGKKRPRD